MDSAFLPDASKAQAAGHRQAFGSQGEIVMLSLGLAVLLVTAKAILLPFPVSTAGEFLRWVLRLAIVASPDVCFVTCLAVVVSLAHAALGRWARAAKFSRLGVFAAFYLCGLYGAAAVPIFRWTMIPLTLPVLSFAGGPSSMASSVGACVGPATVAAVAIGPLAIFLIPWGWRRLVARCSCHGGKPPQMLDRPLPSPRAAIVLVVLVAAYGSVCKSYVQARWTDPNRWERRIAKNPHAVFLASCLRELVQPESARLAGAFDRANVSDFLPSAANAPSPFATLAPDERPQNVIYIVLESTGVEYLGLYGSRHDTTPNLQRLAAQSGVVCDNVYVQTPCSCKSLVALTASVYPRLDWWLIVRDCPEFSIPTLPYVLAQRGYRTCCAHAGYWSWKGRDEFLRRRGVQTLIDASSLPASQVNSWGITDRAMYQAALDWIDQDPQGPFFLLAYTIETHHPYVAPNVWRDFGVGDPDLQRYLNALRQADEHIGWLEKELKRRGLDRSTLIVVTSDHGESFGQHNQRLHSFCIYEPAVHVPVVWIHPALEKLPRRLPQVRQHIDIAPTILDLLGLDAPPAWQGRSMFCPLERRAYFFCTGNDIVLGLRDGPLKYHYYVRTGYEELFDVKADPAESRNLAALHPQQCAQYKSRLGGLAQYQRAFLAQYGAP